MSLSYDRLMHLLERNDTAGLADDALSMNIADMVEFSLLIGPVRLGQIVQRLNWTLDDIWGGSILRQGQAGSSAAAPSVWKSPLLMGQPFPMVGREVTLAALADIHGAVYGRALPPVADAPRPEPAVAAQIQTAIRETIARLSAKQSLRITRDVTKTLPTAAAVPASLSEADFAASAVRLGVEVAAIKAVSKVESGGRSGFDRAGRPKILFEAHYFSRLTARRFDASHPHLAQKSQKAGAAFYSWDQYARLHEAMLLDVEAALSSASWGKFQVMGSNHNGWQNPTDFARAMYVSEANHLISFEAYCADNNLIRHIKTKDWAKFARGYNGPDYAAGDYHGKMARAYAEFSR
jgi:hypothetical protein